MATYEWNQQSATRGAHRINQRCIFSRRSTWSHFLGTGRIVGFDTLSSRESMQSSRQKRARARGEGKRRAWPGVEGVGRYSPRLFEGLNTASSCHMHAASATCWEFCAELEQVWTSVSQMVAGKFDQVDRRAPAKVVVLDPTRPQQGADRLWPSLACHSASLLMNMSCPSMPSVQPWTWSYCKSKRISRRLIYGVSLDLPARCGIVPYLLMPNNAAGHLMVRLSHWQG